MQSTNQEKVFYSASIYMKLVNTRFPLRGTIAPELAWTYARYGVSHLTRGSSFRRAMYLHRGNLYLSDHKTWVSEARCCCKAYFSQWSRGSNPASILVWPFSTSIAASCWVAPIFGPNSPNFRCCFVQ